METATVTEDEIELLPDFDTYDDDSDPVGDEDIDPLVDIKVELTEYDASQHSSEITPGPEKLTKKLGIGTAKGQNKESIRKGLKRGRKKQPEVKCPECGKIYQGNWALNKHLQTHSMERPYKCSFPDCTKSFKTANNQHYHEKLSHSDSRPHTCSHPGCSKSYKVSGDLKFHLNSHKEKPPAAALPSFNCTADSTCSATFTSQLSLKYHITRKHPERGSVTSPPITPFVCDVCSIAFPLESQLNLHRGLHINEKKFPCPEEGCTSAFKFKCTLYEHQRRKHPQERDPFENLMCEVETETTTKNQPEEMQIPNTNIEIDQELSIEKLTVPITLHAPILETTKLQINNEIKSEKEFSNLIITNVVSQGVEVDPIVTIKTEVDLPAEVYAEGSYINDKMEATNEIYKRIQTDSKSSAIGPILTSSKTLTKNQLKIHLECKLCFTKLKLNEDLATHLVKCELYRRNRYRFCIPCNRKFSKADVLKKHSLAAHSTDVGKSLIRKYKCHLCSKEYTTNKNLSYHIESHKTQAKQATFKCSQCDKSYIRKESLGKHVLTHSEDNPFKCTFPNCTKAFKNPSYLTNHLSTHSDERPFKCPEVNCRKAFKFRSNLRTHLGTPHVKIPTNCECV